MAVYKNQTVFLQPLQGFGGQSDFFYLLVGFVVLFVSSVERIRALWQDNPRELGQTHAN